MLCQIQWLPSHIDKLHYRGSPPGRLCTCCLLCLGCHQGDDAYNSDIAVFCNALCNFVCALLGSMNGCAVFECFSLWCLAGPSSLENPTHNSSSLWDGKPFFFHCAAVAGTAVLLVFLFPDRSRKQAECSGRGCASSERSFCFYWHLLELCYVQSKAYAEELMLGFAAESGPASIQSDSLIHSQRCRVGYLRQPEISSLSAKLRIQLLPQYAASLAC